MKKYLKIGRKPINVVLENGKSFKWTWHKIWIYGGMKSDIQEASRLDNSPVDLMLNDDVAKFRFRYKGREVTLASGNQEYGDLDVFVKEVYSFLDCENEDVLDIGTNIGDSAIFFALNNAKKIIALEPYPLGYNFAKLNVSDNNCGAVIELLNAGYGKDGVISLDPGYRNTLGSDLKESKNGKQVPIYSLKSLLSRYDLVSPVLKMDCEGCEYSILDEEEDVLTRFKRIQIEYHYGYERLMKKLQKAGFSVRFTEPQKAFGAEAVNHEMLVGWLFAEKTQ
ncbi:MAG: FkbM family methyltransferase [Thermoplasmataceae archaeon]